MSGLNKKPITQTSNVVAINTIDRVSKAGLADLVIDLLRRGEGEDLDGDKLVAAFLEAYSPIAQARDEKPAKAWRRRRC